jgi:hypothetical protein
MPPLGRTLKQQPEAFGESQGKHAINSIWI